MTIPASRVISLIKKLKQIVHGMPPTMCAQLASTYHKDPFVILVAALLSARTRDSVVINIIHKLFAKARTPQAILDLPLSDIQHIIRPVNYYITKSKSLHALSQKLIQTYNGHVPKTQKELMTLPGVGPKTANLVLAEAFDIPAIAVDTHVQKLANQLGLVHTTTPAQTEAALQKTVPKKYWRDINRFLVVCGQNKCDLSSLKKMLD